MRQLIAHTLFGLLAVVFSAIVISIQITDRRGFANSELHNDVMDLWGVPIEQPVPSLRVVEAGSVFKRLEALPFTDQEITIDADMNYRKRGLVYFSGFDFAFHGRFAAKNEGATALDAVFAFPVNIEKNRVLLSDLSFSVDGSAEPIDLADGGDTLLWTGRLDPDQTRRYEISFRGRGLDSFSYLLDPDLPVRDLSVTINVTGGANYDYPLGVVPAQSLQEIDDGVSLRWHYASLESGVPVGVILPSEKSYDELIARMARRSWVPFLIFFLSIQGLALAGDRRLSGVEAVLLSSGFAFFSVLLPYLAAYWNFLPAYIVSLVLIVGLLTVYGTHLLGTRWRSAVLAILAATLVIPTTAVALEGHTGLIYTVEILVGLAVAMWLSTRPVAVELMANLFPGRFTEEVDHV